MLIEILVAIVLLSAQSVRTSYVVFHSVKQKQLTWIIWVLYAVAALELPIIPVAILAVGWQKNLAILEDSYKQLSWPYIVVYVYLGCMAAQSLLTRMMQYIFVLQLRKQSKTLQVSATLEGIGIICSLVTFLNSEVWVVLFAILGILCLLSSQVLWLSILRRLRKDDVNVEDISVLQQVSLVQIGCFVASVVLLNFSVYYYGGFAYFVHFLLLLSSIQGLKPAYEDMRSANIYFVGLWLLALVAVHALRKFFENKMLSKRFVDRMTMERATTKQKPKEDTPAQVTTDQVKGEQVSTDVIQTRLPSGAKSEFVARRRMSSFAKQV